MGLVKYRPPSKPRICALPDLLGLWRGDEDSCGYIHEGLGREICKKLRPLSELELFQQLYPGRELEDVSDFVRETVARSFRTYMAEKQRRAAT